MSSTRQALFASFIGRYYLLGLQFVSTVVISHLLTPTEIGIYALSAAGVGFAHMLRDFGIGTYVIQEADLTADRIRAAQTVAYVTAWPLAAIVFFSAPYVAHFYNHPGIGQVFHWLSLNFILLPFGTVTNSYLNRQMKFSVTLAIGAAAATLSFVVTVTAAILGATYMSMVWGSLAGTILTVMLLRFVRPSEVPSLPGIKNVKRVLMIGFQITGAEFLTEITASMPDMILGKIQGMEVVAFLSRAVGGVNMVSRSALDGVRPVVVPMFAQINRQKGDIANAYKKTHGLTLAVLWPALLLLFLFAKPVVLLLFGQQWTATVPLVRILCIAQILYIPTCYAEDILKGISRVGSFALLRVTMKSIRLAGILCTVWFGVVPMLWSYVALSVMRYIIVSLVARHYFALQLKDHLLFIREGATICAATLALPLIILACLGTSPSAVSASMMIGLCVIGAICWVGTLRIISHPLWAELSAIVMRSIAYVTPQKSGAK